MLLAGLTVASAESPRSQTSTSALVFTGKAFCSYRRCPVLSNVEKKKKRFLDKACNCGSSKRRGNSSHLIQEYMNLDLSKPLTSPLITCSSVTLKGTYLLMQTIERILTLNWNPQGFFYLFDSLSLLFPTVY